MKVDEALKLLEKHGQEHVFAFWEQLQEEQRSSLLEQIATLDFAAIGRMRDLLAAEDTDAPPAATEPAPVITLDQQGDPAYRAIGEQALRAGEVGVLLVAGGQGTRLGFDGPKGSYPVGPISDATLFEIHARKILALEQVYGAPVPFYVMTSQANDTPTRAFFEGNDFFGLPADHVVFFTQGMWPGLWQDGRIIMDRIDHIFMSPDGHGGVLAALRDRGMLDDMARRGLKTIFFFQVDNPLVEIGDPVFVGLHRHHDAQISIKVCAKRDATEGLGIVVERHGRNAVVEYTELTDEQMSETGDDGRLRFLYGSVAIHVFSVDFLKQESTVDMPLHVAHKKIPYCDDGGRTVKPDAPNAYKFEKFIFDVIPDATTAINVEFARDNEFSPVKNAEGTDSPATAKRDMTRKFARWLTACAVKVPTDHDGDPLHKLEIDPCFALGPEALRDKVKPDLSIIGDHLLK